MDTKKFCENESTIYNTSENNPVCDYPEVPEVIKESPQRNLTQNNGMIKPKFSLKPITGTVTNVITVYHKYLPSCISYYELTVTTKDQQEVRLILSSDTYFVDCFLQMNGVNVIGFYDEMAPMPLIYPPQYHIKVIAIDYPERFVKADIFDCYLVSSDNELQLIVSNNTYIIDEDGKLYCGNISNKYMVVLYSSVTQTMPELTIPNVIVALN
jgi:hypothetical protein